MSEIESEELTVALEKIIHFYKDDMEPYALQTSKQLIDSFFRFVSINPSEDNGEGAQAASGCIDAFVKVIRSCKSNPDLLCKLEDMSIQMLNHSF